MQKKHAVEAQGMGLFGESLNKSFNEFYKSVAPSDCIHALKGGYLAFAYNSQ